MQVNPSIYHAQVPVHYFRLIPPVIDSEGFIHSNDDQDDCWWWSVLILWFCFCYWFNCWYYSYYNCYFYWSIQFKSIDVSITTTFHVNYQLEGFCVHPLLTYSNGECSAVVSSTSRIRYMMMMILLCSCIRYRSIRWYIILEFWSYSILSSVVVFFEQGGLCYYIDYFYWSVLDLLILTHTSLGRAVQVHPSFVLYYTYWS